VGRGQTAMLWSVVPRKHAGLLSIWFIRGWPGVSFSSNAAEVGSVHDIKVREC
jgi:hypothetical protein